MPLRSAHQPLHQEQAGPRRHLLGQNPWMHHHS